MRGFERSALAPAAGRFDGGAGDVGRVWGEQKREHGGDFVGLAQRAKGAHGTDERVERDVCECWGVVGGVAGGHAGGGGAGGDRVDGDVSLGEFGSLALSLGASLGLSILVWQYIFGIQLFWVIVPLAVMLLLAVGADYNLLLISRLKEELHAGLKTGNIRAMAGTGGVVTAAG